MFKLRHTLEGETLGVVYCVILRSMRYNHKDKVWYEQSRGYHSVWADKEAAERQAKIRNDSTMMYLYHVEKRCIKIYKNYSNRPIVRFPDSVGFIDVNL